MTGRWWSRAALPALGVGAAFLLTACFSPMACSTVKFISSVEVQVEGDVAFIDACAWSECGTSDFVISERESGTWNIQFMNELPDELTLQAFGTGGVLLAEEGFELEWTPVGDTGPCAGPVRTPPIEFLVG